MKKGWFLAVVIVLAWSCDFKESMKKHDEAQNQADYIITNLTQPEVLEIFPEKYFVRNDLEPIFKHLKENCDWSNRDGKFVDFFTIGTIGKVNQTGFIYEYYLKCDSVRVVIVFDMDKETPELITFNMEPIENENKYIVHPENQLKYRNN